MTSQRFARRSRLAAIAAIPLMGAVLLVVVWSTVRSIGSASETTIRGEAEALQGALRSELFGPGEGSPEDRLQRVLEDHAGDGVRYIAILRPDGQVHTAGTPVSTDPVTTAARRNDRPRRVGDRIRVAHVRPPRRGNRPTPSGIVFEFEPRVADELETTARWLLVVGVLAALTLTGVAAFLVRWSLGRERAVREAEQARRLATLGQMSAVLAHEIRNPLASLKGNAQLLSAMLPAGERPRAKAERVVEEAQRLESLSNDLLEFARDGELRRSDLEPVDLVQEAASATAGDRVVIESSAAPRTWSLDRAKVRQVLINLLDNAAEMGDGPIEVRVAQEARDLVITVRDHGPGIEAADLPHLFEPFFTRRVQGTGLGLAIAKRLVDLHGGSIRADNAAGGGAEFRMTFPRG